jgi:lipid-binding SYLF domain-containing protein
MTWETYSAVEHSDGQIIYSVHCSYPASFNPSPWGWGGVTSLLSPQLFIKRPLRTRVLHIIKRAKIIMIFPLILKEGLQSRAAREVT